MLVPFSVADFLDRAEQVYGERIGVIAEPDQPAPSLSDLTYAQIGDLAKRQAAHLDGLGIGFGDRVAVVSQNAARATRSDLHPVPRRRRAHRHRQAKKFKLRAPTGRATNVKSTDMSTLARGVIGKRMGTPATVVLTLLLSALSACSDGDGRPVNNATPTLITPASPATSLASPSEEELASRAATTTLAKYYQVRNLLRQDPSQPLRLLNSVATSTELAAQQNLFKRERKQGLRQVGDTKVIESQVQSVSLDNSDPTAGKVPTVQIDLCFDVSEVDVVDRNGKSVISPDRPDTGWIQFLVSNYRWDTETSGGWRVASSLDIGRTPCKPS